MRGRRKKKKNGGEKKRGQEIPFNKHSCALTNDWKAKMCVTSPPLSTSRPLIMYAFLFPSSPSRCAPSPASMRWRHGTVGQRVECLPKAEFARILVISCTAPNVTLLHHAPSSLHLHLSPSPKMHQGARFCRLPLQIRAGYPSLPPCSLPGASHTPFNTNTS